jgi:cytochrome c oxidase cbb3-type subunit II
MNRALLMIFGLGLTLAASYGGILLALQLQLGALQPRTQDHPAPPYPSPRPGDAQQGQQVYRAFGCNQCHSQQVRPQGFGNDFERGWGERRTVALDYLADDPVMTGSMRIGPDLANFAIRPPRKFALPWQYRSALPDEQRKELAEWILRHLYSPQIHAPGSSMPPHPFLFRKQKVRRAPTPDALSLPPAIAVEPGFEIVPKPEAQALVAYLLSLRADTPLDEAPVPRPPGQRVRRLTSTNAVELPK